MHTWVRPGPEGGARASVKEKWRDFPGGPEVKILRFQFRVRVPSLVGELGSCMLCGQENKRSFTATKEKGALQSICLKEAFSEWRETGILKAKHIIRNWGRRWEERAEGIPRKSCL